MSIQNLPRVENFRQGKMISLPVSVPVSVEKTNHSIEKRVWSTEEGEMLLDLYDANKERFKDPAVRKIGVWAEICDAINSRFNSDFTPERCHQKLRNFKNDFQKVIMLEKKDCRHFERLHRIFLQSSEKPLQSPAALKRKLSQLATPKPPGTELTSPEKKPKFVLPDFRSRKSKAGTSVHTPEPGSHMADSAVRKTNPRPNTGKKNSTGRKNPKPERKRPSMSNPQIGISNSEVPPLYGNMPVASDSRINRPKFSGYLSIPAEQTMVGYPRVPPKPYNLEEVSHGATDGLQTGQSAMAEIRTTDCVPGSRVNLAQDQYPMVPVVCKVENEDGGHSDITQGQYSVSSETRNVEFVKNSRGNVLQGQYPEIAGIRRPENIYPASGQNDQRSPGPEPSVSRFGSNVTEPDVSHLVIYGAQGQSPVTQDARRSEFLPVSRVDLSEARPDVSSSEARITERLNVPRSQVAEENQRRRSADATWARISMSQDHPIISLETSTPGVVPEYSTSAPRSSGVVPEYSTSAQRSSGVVPEFSTSAPRSRSSTNVVNGVLPVPVRYYSTNSTAFSQGSSTEAANRINEVVEVYDEDFAMSDAQNPPETREDVFVPQQHAAHNHSQILTNRGSTGSSGLQVNKNTPENTKQAARTVGTPSEVPLAGSPRAEIQDKEAPATENASHGHHQLIDLTDTATQGHDGLERIAQCIDSWREECKEREQARIKRELVRDRRMEEMHQETVRLTTKFVELFGAFVAKIGETGDQIY